MIDKFGTLSVKYLKDISDPFANIVTKVLERSYDALTEHLTAAIDKRESAKDPEWDIEIESILTFRGFTLKVDHEIAYATRVPGVDLFWKDTLKFLESESDDERRGYTAPYEF